MADQYYIEEGYIEQAYFERIVVSDAISLSGAFTPTATVDIADDTGYFIPDYIAEGYIGVAITEADAAISATATIAVSATRIQEGNASLDIAASASTDGAAVRDADSDLTVTATESSTVGVIKQGNIALTGAFSPTISAVAILRPDVFLESSVSFEATAVKTTSNEVILSYLASLDAQADRTRGYDSALSASFGNSTTANITKTTSSTLSSQSTLSVTALKLKPGEIPLSATASLSIDGKALCERPLAPEIDNANYSTFGALGPKFGTYGAVVTKTNNLEYIVCRDAMPDNSTEWFAEGWIAKSSATQESTFFSLMYDEDKTVNDKEIFFFGDVNGDRASITVRNDTTVSNEIDTVDNAVTDQWQHFVFGWQPGSGAKLWLDGSLLLTEDDITSVTVRTNKFGRLLFGRKYQGDTVTDNSTWIDEFRIVKGTNVLNKYGYDWTNSSITVPTSAFTDTVDTKILLHFENSGEDDFIAGLAQASISATATLAVDVLRIQPGASSVSSAFTLSASGELIIEGNATLDSAATVDATIGSIKQFEAALTGAFSPSIVADAVKNTFAILDTNTTLGVTVEVIAGLASDVSASASLSAVGDRIRFGIATPSAAFSATATAGGVLKDYTADINSAFTVDAEVDTDFLKLFDGAQIESDGAQVVDSLTTGENAYLNGAVSNFWLQLSENPNPGDSIELYRGSGTGTNGFSNIVLIRNPSDSTYTLTVTTRYKITLDFTYDDGPPYPYYYDGHFGYITLPSSFDWTDWHNIHVPLTLPVEMEVSDDGTEIGKNASIITGQWAIDGTDYSATQDDIVNEPNLGDLPGVVLQSLAGDAGTWGDTSTSIDIFIENLWVKDWDQDYSVNPYNIDGGVFYNLGRAPLGNNGTVNSVTPEVYHDWEDGLLESANNITPTWDYTIASGDVRTGLIITAQATISVTASVACDAALVALASADLAVSATQSTDNVRVRFADTALEVNITDSFTAVKTTDVDSAMSTAITLTATAVKTTDITANPSSAFNIVIDNVRAKLFEPSLSSAFTMPTVDAVSTRGLAVAIDSAATVDAQPLRIKQLEANLTGAFAPTIDAVAILRPEVFLEVATATTVDAVIFAGAQSNISSAFTLEVAAERTVDYTADLSVTATIPNANVFRIQTAQADLSSAFTSETVNARTRDNNIALDIAVTAQIAPYRVRYFTIGLNTAVNVITDAQLLVEAEATLSAQFDDTFVVTRLRRAEADLSAFAFTVTAGDLIAIDELRQLLVPAETRFIKVAAESRRIIAPSETRILEV